MNTADHMNAVRRQPAGTVADVALLLEGTYPFVSGGVSAWVHDIIRGLPEVTFSLVFVGGSRETYGPPRYDLPPNVVHLECHYLSDRSPRPAVAPRISAAALEHNEALHRNLREGSGPVPAALLHGLVEHLGRPGGLSREAFLTGQPTWERICAAYREHSREPSFLDYFWTVRSMHAPVFALAEIARNLPPARVFHSVSTGYAGFLGTLLRHRHQRPFLITEHGIYTKERKIDLASAGWIRDDPGLFAATTADAGYVRELWTRFFVGLGRMAYSSADSIVSLYEGNRKRQIADGAEPSRTRVIPNGVDVPRFAALRERRPPQVPPVVLLVGRIVPIKDVRTFVRAMSIVCERLPEAQGWIAGPASEDPAYAQECEALVSSLGLAGRVKFLGFRRPDELLPNAGLLALTSISEALPLALLEAFASGLPVVATDVGACRELVEGRDDADRALGAAGAVVPIARPELAAQAILELLGDPERWNRAQAAGIQRVERYYAQGEMLDRYRTLYEEAIRWRA